MQREAHVLAAGGERATRPRDAASLIILRRSGREFEALLGRRLNRSRFMPGYYVFPGGAVEREDSRARPATDLHPEAAAAAAVAGRASKARTLAMTAVRETFEETGLMVGSKGDVGKLKSPSWSAMQHLSLAPALDRLRYIGRAITPTDSPIRFHARFFVTDVESTVGEVAGDGELADLRWIALSQLDDFPIIDVTRFMFGHAVQTVTAPAEHDPGCPLFLWRGGGPWVRYFHADRASPHITPGIR